MRAEKAQAVLKTGQNRSLPSEGRVYAWSISSGASLLLAFLYTTFAMASVLQLPDLRVSEHYLRTTGVAICKNADLTGFVDSITGFENKLLIYVHIDIASPHDHCNCIKLVVSRVHCRATTCKQRRVIRIILRVNRHPSCQKRSISTHTKVVP